MIRINFQVPGYSVGEYCEAWLSKGAQHKARVVSIGLPSYSWKDTFKEYAEGRGFRVLFR